MVAIVTCKTCGTSFSAKENWIKRGWGKYCSRSCSAKAQLRGKFVKCFLCNKQIWRRPKDLEKSKSGTFFCSKRCQTIWRNAFFAGDKHGNWKGGSSSYRDALKRSGKPTRCKLCSLADKRVLAVHHADGNRGNNSVDNLMWLCHNCHFLVHHHEEERKK